MSEQTAALLQLIAYLGLILGVIGTVAPVLPGPVLIWLSTLLWAWADGFQTIGWPTLLILAVLAILAEISDVVLAGMGAKQGGAAWSSMMVAGIAAIIGFFIFNFIGAIVGAFLGLLAWEARRHDWQWEKGWRASSRFIIGYLLALIVKMFFAAIMVIIFIWQAFYA